MFNLLTYCYLVPNGNINKEDELYVIDLIKIYVFRKIKWLQMLFNKIIFAPMMIQFRGK